MRWKVWKDILFFINNGIPFIVVFISTFVFIGSKYLRFKLVVDQIVPLNEVKQRIATGEQLIVYIIDPLKCAICMEQFPRVKVILERAELPFVLVNYWEDEEFVKSLGQWKRVPALIAYSDKSVVRLIDASKVSTLSMVQYEQFANEVSLQWKAV